MSSLSQQTCLSHFAREAVAQCPECRHFFCRECIVEHGDRVVCSSCLRKLAAAGASAGKSWRAPAEVGLAFIGVLTSVLFFYWMGQLLLLIPSAFHDATLWDIGGGQ